MLYSVQHLNIFSMLNDVYVDCAVIHSSKEYFFAIELLQIWTTAPCDNLEGSTLCPLQPMKLIVLKEWVYILGI